MSAEKKVMAFGTFDYLHAGHEHYLQKAKKLGGYLIIVVARDETVKKIKGKFPDHTENQRLKNLKKLSFVDKVIIGNSKDKHKVITKFKPDIIVLGYDQYAFTMGLKKVIINNNLDTEIVRMEAYKPSIFKSSLVKQRNEDKKKS